MFYRFFRYISFAMLMISHQYVLATPDYSREARWADEIIPAILVGEVVYLQQPNGHRFLGIHAEANNSQTCILLAHGMGLHPDWGFISLLRQRLNDFGYATLSIQMPVLEATAGFDDYPKIFPDAVQRLEVAVEFLKQKGYQHIVLASHSNGSRMSRIFMTGNPVNVNAWVAISLTRDETFMGIDAPVFDVYGENDLSHVLSSIKKRQDSFNGNSASRQLEIKGAGHFYVGQEEDLVIAIKDFLKDLKFN